MRTIEVDNEVFAFLEKHARPFVDTPNSALRRLLGIGQRKISGKSEAFTQIDNRKGAHNRSRALKTDLEILVKEGLIGIGERLYLVDFKGNRVQKVQAIISGSHLIYNNRPYSMTSIAKEELAKLGFKSKDVRGPAHWVTKGGKSIKDLWQQYLDKNPQSPED